MSLETGARRRKGQNLKFEGRKGSEMSACDFEHFVSIIAKQVLEEYLFLRKEEMNVSAA